VTAQTIFVTGTDTGVGKTLIACALLHKLRGRKRAVCGFKPVASGCERTKDGLRNADALALQAAAGTNEPYESINPYALARPIAPHLAAAEMGEHLSVLKLREAHAAIAGRHELIVAEGAGGWRVPLDESWTMAEFVAEQEWPVILVVGMRLGCINHALLSADSIMRGTRLIGWVANVLPPVMDALEENIETLQAHLSAPLLGVVPANPDADAADAALDIAPIEALLSSGRKPKFRRVTSRPAS
jgi:dethiobiotin synthetase